MQPRDAKDGTLSCVTVLRPSHLATLKEQPRTQTETPTRSQHPKGLGKVQTCEAGRGKKDVLDQFRSHHGDKHFLVTEWITGTPMCITFHDRGSVHFRSRLKPRGGERTTFTPPTQQKIADVVAQLKRNALPRLFCEVARWVEANDVQAEEVDADELSNIAVVGVLFGGEDGVGPFYAPDYHLCANTLWYKNKTGRRHKLPLLAARSLFQHCGFITEPVVGQGTLDECLYKSACTIAMDSRVPAMLHTERPSGGSATLANRMLPLCCRNMPDDEEADPPCGIREPNPRAGHNIYITAPGGMTHRVELRVVNRQQRPLPRGDTFLPTFEEAVAHGSFSSASLSATPTTEAQDDGVCEATEPKRRPISQPQKNETACESGCLRDVLGRILGNNVGSIDEGLAPLPKISSHRLLVAHQLQPYIARYRLCAMLGVSPPGSMPGCPALTRDSVLRLLYVENLQLYALYTSLFPDEQNLMWMYFGM